MDECHFQQHGSRLAAWFPAEEKDPVVPHAPVRNKIGIIGAVRVTDGTLVACEENKFNAQTIEAFFSELLKHRDKDKMMVVVLDNARFHHAKILSQWLDKHSEHFSLDFLPPYSPQLNHIERVWKLLRRLCTHNQYFEKLTVLRSVVLSKLSEWSSPNKSLAQLCAII
ncbi:MAG: IS630 family transposase [Planctomycetes bacterium]|nr:IS630 family transposase [Planctomycetota bacterium]